LNLSLQGRRALVCGGSRGIGRAGAEALAALGADVSIVARDPGALESALASLRQAGPAGQHQRIVADSAQPQALVDAALRAAADRPFQILINNSGGPPGGPITAASAEAFLLAFTAHLLAAQALTQALLPGMIAAGYGRVINVISTSVKTPLKGLGVSNTIRAAVASWAKTLAGEVGRHGITVNNVLPGMTRTDRLDAIITARANKEARPIESIEAEMLGEIPLGRFGQAAEIGAAIGFLASPAASYINGINLPVDGGRTVCL
jgi:3-oxoacyl-[acyl-carrier protein] reductase